MGMTPDEAHIAVHGLTMAYGSFVIQRDLTFTVWRGDIFIIMGGSGCGRSTLLRHLIGLKPPAAGEVRIDGESLWEAPPEAQDRPYHDFVTVDWSRHWPSEDVWAARKDA